MRSNELRLPCGCLMWNEGEAFVFVPHALDCTYYQYVLQQSGEQGKPLEMRVVE